MNIFIKKHRYHLITLIVLLLTTMLSGGYLLTTSSKTKAQQDYNAETLKQISVQNLRQANTTTLQQINNNTNIVTNRQIKASTDTKTKQEQPNNDTNRNNNLTIFSCQQNCIDIQIKIPLKAYILELKADTTAYEAMVILQQNTNFSFNGNNYASLGFFVNEINGITNDIKNNKYWIYYINGESAKVGISNYKLNNNDLIEWKYEKSTF